jgi:DNA-binding FadR family transcriptional regulator
MTDLPNGMNKEKLYRGPALNRAIQARIKFYITNNHLRAGDPLPPETQLASDLGISRGSVREAIKALESLGIVEVRHGTGLFVRHFNFDSILDFLSFGVSFDPSKILEIMHVRKWLETAAIGEAIQRITDDDIRQIEEVLDQWEQKIAAHGATTDEDRTFHSLLYKPLGNQTLSALIDTFFVVYHNVRGTLIPANRNPAATISDHRAILAAVRRRDETLSRQLIREHYRNFESLIEEALAAPPQSTSQPPEQLNKIKLIQPV